MYGPIIRILLRVLAGYLMARGLPSQVIDVLYDPELAMTVETILGAAIWAGTEALYVIAKRLGWST